MLTKSEFRILFMIASGLSVKEIAGDLKLSEKTIRIHINHIYEKTGLTNYVQITHYAIEHKLIPVIHFPNKN